MAYREQEEESPGLAGIAEAIGSTIPLGYGSNPYLPKVASFASGALSGFSAGRAARRKLAAANRLKALESKIGFPIDTLTRLSKDAQLQILQRAGLLDDNGMDVPLDEYGGETMKNIMERGVAPTITSGVGEGTDIFAGVKGGPMQTSTAPEGQRPHEGIPPLNSIPESQRSFFLNKLNPDVAQYESPADAALREERGVRTEGLRAALPYIPELNESLIAQRRASAESSSQLAQSRRQYRDLARSSSKGRQAPADLVETLRRNGVQIPETANPTYQDLDYYTRGSHPYGELSKLVDDYADAFLTRIDDGQAVSEKEVRDFAAKTLGGQLQQISLRMSTDAALAQKLFIQQIMERIRTYNTTIHSRPAPSEIGDQGEEPYVLPGFEDEE